MFLMTGGLTVACGILFFFVIPDDVSTSWFLTEEEKVLCVERIRSNQQGVKNTTLKKYQAIEALKDPAVSLSYRLPYTANQNRRGSLCSSLSVLLFPTEVSYSAQSTHLESLCILSIQFILLQ